MTPDQVKYHALFEAVASMRHYQEQSERYRCSEDRAKYLRWQKKVDNLIKEENKERQSLQRKIF